MLLGVAPYMSVSTRMPSPSSSSASRSCTAASAAVGVGVADEVELLAAARALPEHMGGAFDQAVGERAVGDDEDAYHCEFLESLSDQKQHFTRI